MTVRAVHVHRSNFFRLKTQEKRAMLVTTAKTLAKLKAASNRAHSELTKASAPKLIQECKSLSNWKTPAGGMHPLFVQDFKVSQLCQPLQLPFQLLLPPDFHLLNCSKSAQSAAPVQIQGQQASTRDRDGPSNLQAAVPDLPPEPDPTGPDSVRSTPGLPRPTLCRPMPAPDPDPPDKEVSLKSKRNWG